MIWFYFLAVLWVILMWVLVDSEKIEIWNLGFGDGDVLVEMIILLLFDSFSLMIYNFICVFDTFQITVGKVLSNQSKVGSV